MTRSGERLVTYAILLIFSLGALLPIVGVIGLAMHEPGELVSGFGLPDSLNFGTFTYAWERANFSTYVQSSVIVSSAVVAASTFISILAGYAFGTMRFKGDTFLFYTLLLGMIIPFEAVVVPLYYDMREFGLTDSYWSLILPQVGLNVSFGTFWMRAYFRSVPRTMVDAAHIDGASQWRILWRVLLPPGRPAVVTLMLLLFMWSWNEFLLALVMIQSDELRTAPLGLAFFVGNRSTDYVGLAAASLIVALPVVVIYLILQRDFIRGMFTGALRG
jgi:raffinose/stachyose/melibiose transport system permease protein